jgi:thiamine-monophosphate kinase
MYAWTTTGTSSSIDGSGCVTEWSRYRAAVPDVTPAGPTLADLGETGILARIFPRLPAGGQVEVPPGDDAAVVVAADGRVVATTDLMVQGRDWRDDWSSAYDVGWKVAAQNLADVAAMGAVPTGLLVGLVAPGTLPVSWLEGLADGLAASCASTGASVVGGDLSSGDVVVVAVTALGDLQGRAPVLRSGARPGDLVAVAGRLGWSGAGLDLLRAGRPEVAPRLVASHLRPEPPYAAGPAAASGGAHALMDVSDGLLRDAGRMADASGVSIDLDGDRLGGYADQLIEAAKALGDNGFGLGWVLSGGEDHPLLATFPGPDLPDGFEPIGTIVDRAAEAVLVDGRPASTLSGGLPTWDHFGH